MALCNSVHVLEDIVLPSFIVSSKNNEDDKKDSADDSGIISEVEKEKPEPTVSRGRSLSEAIERNITVTLRRVSFEMSSMKVDPITERELPSKDGGIHSYCSGQDASQSSMGQSRENSIAHCSAADICQVVPEDRSSIPQSPSQEFRYPAQNIRPQSLGRSQNPGGLFEPVEVIARGSHSIIFRGLTADGSDVAIKMLREEEMTNVTAKMEFSSEMRLLERINHPNVIQLIGIGSEPTPFLALEWMAGGTLQTRLNNTRKRKSFSEVLFNRPISMIETLRIGLNLADAMDYLHRRVDSRATIIHRDLKPENIGFTENGELKVLDFGLAICVKKFDYQHTTYKMTGNTGSLRYMAPEVAKYLPYNEKVDVHSFGIILWQVATVDIPFKGFNKDDFLKYVVSQGLRPDLRSSWPRDFQNLLTSCWNNEHLKRPAFKEIIDVLKSLESLSTRRNTMA